MLHPFPIRQRPRRWHFLPVNCGAFQNDQEQFTFWSVKVSCLLPTALSAMVLVPECSSNFKRSSSEALQHHSQNLVIPTDSSVDIWFKAEQTLQPERFQVILVITNSCAPRRDVTYFYSASVPHARAESPLAQTYFWSFCFWEMLLKLLNSSPALSW